MDKGGRWNPPGSWPALYLNRDLNTARSQLDRMLEGTPVQIDDLLDDAYELAAARLPPGQVALDVISDEGVAAAGLPATYPRAATGRCVTWDICWPIARIAFDQGLDGVECRSAATLDGRGRELCWWPRGRQGQPVGGRVPLGHWRQPEVNDPSTLFF